MEYKGTLVKVSSKKEAVQFRWHDTPSRMELHGFMWTACADVSREQLRILGHCGVLSIHSPSGLFLKIPLRRVPLNMGGDVSAFGPVSHDRKAAVLKGDSRADKWTGEVSFHDDPGDEEAGREPVLWRTFPGETYIRVDMVDASEVKHHSGER